jgi:hypothetical protein
MKNERKLASRISVAGALGLVLMGTLMGCDGRTSQSLCSQATGPILGLPGTYEINSRDSDTFGVHTDTFTIEPQLGKLTYSLKTSDDDDAMVACNVGGVYILESEKPKIGGFQQARLYVTEAGLHIHPMLYDKVKLDAAGIPNHVEMIPENVKNILGKTMTHRVETLLAHVVKMFDDAPTTIAALIIDNSDVPGSKLVQYSKPMLLGLTAFRQ